VANVMSAAVVAQSHLRPDRYNLAAGRGPDPHCGQRSGAKHRGPSGTPEALFLPNVGNLREPSGTRSPRRLAVSLLVFGFGVCAFTRVVGPSGIDPTGHHLPMVGSVGLPTQDCTRRAVLDAR